MLQNKRVFSLRPYLVILLPRIATVLAFEDVRGPQRKVPDDGRLLRNLVGVSQLARDLWRKKGEYSK